MTHPPRVTRIAQGERAATRWRPADRELLERVEDHQVVRALFRARVDDPGARLPRNATSLLAALRAVPGAEEQLAHATSGDLGGLGEWLEQLHEAPPRDADDPRWASALMHGLAVFEERVASALAGRDPLAADEARLRALGFALRTEDDYLRDAARAVAGDALRGDDLDGVARAWRLHLLDEAAASAPRGAPRQTPNSARALRFLTRVSDAAARVHLPLDAPRVVDAELHASALRRETIELVIQPLEHDLAEAMARDNDHARELDLMRAIVSVWSWTDRDPLVGRTILEVGVDLGWRYYQEKQWPALEGLDQHTRPVVDAFANRHIETDSHRLESSELAYAAKIAQLLVFRAERSDELGDQIVHAEKALAVCSTHRNGRLVLSNLLAARALRALDQAPLIGRAAFVARAEADVRRARELWPEGSRLERATRRLEREGVNFG